MSIRILHRLYGLLFFLAAIAGLLAFGMPTMRAASQAAGFSDIAGGSKAQMEVVLRADSAPAPGGVANFTFAIKPLRNAPDLTVTWQLPDGGEVVGGPMVETLGAVASGVTVTQTRQVRFANPGIYTVRVQATYHPDSATTFNAVGVLFFTIDASGSTASDGDPRFVPYQPPSFKPTIDKSGMAVSAGAWGTNVPQGCFSVHGFLSREDRRPAPNPPRYVDVTGSAVPVHHVKVELREEDTLFDDSYGFDVTDSAGIFEFNFCDGDGFLNDELELYYRVCSEIVDEDGHQIARIQDREDEEPYCWTSSGTVDSEGGNVNFPAQNWTLNTIEAAIYNIGDSLYWATKYWNDNLSPGVPKMDRSVTVKWERGKKVIGAFYNDGATFMSLGDDVSDPDEWDDSVIIHEWGHFVDHQFSCNQSPGGSHSFSGVNAGTGGDKLAWGEGYGNYLQSAVRTTIPSSSDANFYLDIDTANFDMEVVPNANQLSEGGIGSLLWDFIDNANDSGDTVNHGHARIQKVFTDPAFQGNPQCNMTRFLKVWKDLAMPTDAPTAATVTQNVSIANPFAAAAVAAGTPLLTVANLQATNTVAPNDYRWWDQVTMVVDNSTSMALPAEAPKIDAVKTLIREQINDLSKNPLGTEFDIYSFNAGSYDPSPVSEGRFFAEQINPALDALQANGADTGCPVNGIYALSQAVQNKYDGQAWLYTDGEERPYTSVDYIQQQLNNRLIQGSVVLLGGCSAPLNDPRSLTGPEENFLGVAADGLETAGIVPYLLTAIGTGGSFLFVAPDQLANATDILRAQAAHSAGAGRWSDYVSPDYTYRWDRLLSWEYNWINPVTYRGQAAEDSLLIAGLPPVNVYGTTYTHLHVLEYGIISMGDLATPANSLSRDLDILFDFDLKWYFDSNPNLAAANAPDAPDDGYVQSVYADDVGEWLVITVDGLSDPAQERRAYQALINKNTGEIRYQYLSVPNGEAGNALIGVSDSDINFTYDSVYPSINDASGAVSGMGYKFIAAPPQPSKSFIVAVDSKMSGVGFLLTGYSGYLNPMAITYPDGTAVDCTDTDNVLCLNLSSGLVQYVQVNVNGNGGVYTATVSGDGTFSFNAMAASAIHAKGLGKRTLSLDLQPLKVDFGQAADGGVLDGWLQGVNGAAFGSPFAFYDDGAHDDGEAGDGLFGSDGFTPPGRGVAYLWVQGNVNGERIVRSDPAPFNFQPINVQPEPALVQGFVGSSIAPGFSVTNQDTVQHCYSWEVEVPAGFEFVTSSGSPFCVPAGQTGHPFATFNFPDTGIPGGATAQMSANFFETEQGSIVGGTTTTVAMFRPLADVELDNRWISTPLRPNSTDTVTMSINLLDDQGQKSGWSGGLGYTLDTTLGSVTSPTGVFENGRMPIVFTSGGETGTALITFVLEGSATTTTTLEISEALAQEIDLVASPNDLRGEDQTTSELVATLRDSWGDPVVGQQVRLAVSDDDGREVNGTIEGSSVFTGTTDSNGQVSATFTKGEDQTYLATVRAEALEPDGASFRVTLEDSETLIFSGAAPNAPAFYIPWIRSK